MIGTILGGRYRVESLIGSGGMANVYKAYDGLEKRTVAVKMLKDEHRDDAEFVRRFAKEAQAVLTLSHPNIVESYDVGEDEATGATYIVLEYVEGGTLKDLIKEKGALSPKVAVGIACQVLDALQHAHEWGIIHRDVKPQNVMITPKGKAKLADFGIARDTAATTRTFAGTNVIGSVHYISPEQARGDVATAESDIYSCSVMLYEMLTGQVPFAGDNSVAIALKHLQEEIVPPIEVNPRLPRALSDVVVKGAAKNPSLRYAAAADMRADLLRALREPHGKFARMNRMIAARERKNGGVSVGNIALVVVVMLGLFGSAFLIIQSVRQRGESGAAEFIVPTLTGKTLDEARDLAVLRGFEVAVGDYSSSEEYPEGQVMSQTPIKGANGNQGDVITVVVSSGAGAAVAPELVGKTLQEALLLLAEEDLQIGQTQYAVSEELEGQIIRQEPEAGTHMEPDETVSVWVSGTERQGVELPSFSGMSPSLAVEAAQKNGFQHIWVRYSTPEAGQGEDT
ncbi:MAG: serine/threonine-protein kinase, partial [Clostridia bacterium]|nr:serine/threonine-protein kinase [Clostridia bacterium]